jgi:hypothetical protein
VKQPREGVHTKEVGVHRHEECTQGWGVSVPRDVKVDECMGSFGCMWVHEGVHGLFGCIGP